MTPDYTAYIVAAYALCFIALGWAVVDSLIAWRKERDR